MSPPQWEIDLEVNVAPRTWPGINKPGGHGKVVKIHYSSLGVVDSLDVRYTLGKNIDTNLDTDLVKPHVELNRGRRSRRGRDFFATEYHAKDAVNTPEENVKIADDEEKENDDPVENTRATAKERTKPASKGKKPNPSKKKKKTATTNNSRPRDKVPSKDEDVPKKKRSKTNGTGNVAAQGKKKTPATTAATVTSVAKKKKSSDDVVRDGVPEYVVTDASASLRVLSPLAVGKAGPVDNPTLSPPVSAEEPPEATTNVARKTLKNVFEDQMQEATCYIDSLVGGKPNAKAAPVASSNVIEPAKPPPLDEVRCQEFTRMFSRVMRQSESLPADDLFHTVNELAQSLGSDPFTMEEMDPFVSKLMTEDKVMLSEGYFYVI